MSENNSITSIPKPGSRTPIPKVPRVWATRPRGPRKPIVSTLTQEELHADLSYDPDTGVFRRRSGAMVGDSEAGTVNGSGYREIRVRTQRYLAHRLAWFYVYGVWPKEQIDHINRIKTDNRIANLRDVTPLENSQNRLPQSRWSPRVSDTGVDTAGRVRGVVWRKDVSKWVAYISVNGKQKHLGYFLTVEGANLARIEAEVEFGVVL